MFYPVNLKRNLLSWTVKGSLCLWDVLRFPLSCFLHCKQNSLLQFRSGLFILNQFTLSVFFHFSFFFFFKWWNMYWVSIISSDCTLKIPTKGNQTKHFFSFWKCVASQLYIQSWFCFVLKCVGLLFFCSSLVCFSGLWFGLPDEGGGLSDEIATAHLGVGGWGWAMYHCF